MCLNLFYSVLELERLTLAGNWQTFPHKAGREKRFDLDPNKIVWGPLVLADANNPERIAPAPSPPSEAAALPVASSSTLPDASSPPPYREPSLAESSRRTWWWSLGRSRDSDSGGSRGGGSLSSSEKR